MAQLDGDAGAQAISLAHVQFELVARRRAEAVLRAVRDAATRQRTKLFSQSRTLRVQYRCSPERYAADIDLGPMPSDKAPARYPKCGSGKKPPNSRPRLQSSLLAYCE